MACPAGSTSPGCPRPRGSAWSRSCPGSLLRADSPTSVAHCLGGFRSGARVPASRSKQRQTVLFRCCRVPPARGRSVAVVHPSAIFEPPCRTWRADAATRSGPPARRSDRCLVCRVDPRRSRCRTRGPWPRAASTGSRTARSAPARARRRGFPRTAGRTRGRSRRSEARRRQLCERCSSANCCASAISSSMLSSLSSRRLSSFCSSAFL